MGQDGPDSRVTILPGHVLQLDLVDVVDSVVQVHGQEAWVFVGGLASQPSAGGVDDAFTTDGGGMRTGCRVLSDSQSFFTVTGSCLLFSS